MDEEKQNNAGNSSELGALLSDPEALSKMAGALSRLGILDDTVESSTDEKPSVPASTPANTPNPLSSLLSSPEILSKLPSILSALGGLSGKGAPPPSQPEKKHDSDRRIALLLALRPYLSPRRREIIDYLIKMNKLGELFKNL